MTGKKEDAIVVCCAVLLGLADSHDSKSATVFEQVASLVTDLVSDFFSAQNLITNLITSDRITFVY